MHEGDGVDAVVGNKCHFKANWKQIFKVVEVILKQILKLLLLSFYAWSFAPQWFSYGRRRCSDGSCLPQAVLCLIELPVSQDVLWYCWRERLLNAPPDSVTFPTLSEVVKLGAILFKQYFHICYFSVVCSTCAFNNATSFSELLVNFVNYFRLKTNVSMNTLHTSKQANSYKCSRLHGLNFSPEINLNITLPTHQLAIEGSSRVVNEAATKLVNVAT